MSPSPRPVFGKRGAPPAAAAPIATVQALDQTAFFASVRAELGETGERENVVVGFSYKAACLAGLVVGCAFAGFDIHGEAAGRELEQVTSVLGPKVDLSSVGPALLALGLVGGARVCAFSALLVHAVLAKAGVTSRFAYAAGGAASAALLGQARLAVFGHPPTHGWAIELAAGAAAAFLYRVIAGARPA